MWVKRREYDRLCAALVQMRDERDGKHAALMDYAEAVNKTGYALIGNRLVRVKSGLRSEDAEELTRLQRAVEEQRLVIQQIVELLADVETPDDALIAARYAMKLVSKARKNWGLV